MKPGINAKLGIPMLIVVFAASAALMWGGTQLVKEDEAAAANGGGAAGGGGATGGPVAVTIVAENTSFNPTTITASTGVEVTITFDNRDAGVLHNVAFYTNRTAAQSIFVGELITGPAQAVETFTSPSTAGNYFFRCDVHPDQMTGSFNVQ